MTLLSRNPSTLLLFVSSALVHIHAFTSTSTLGRRSLSLFYKDVNKDDEIYTFPNNLDLPEMSHDWKPEMPSYPQGISPFDVFEESLGQEEECIEQLDQPMNDIISSSLTDPFKDVMATSTESSEKKARSSTYMYKRGGSSSSIAQKYKSQQLKTDGTSRHLSSNVSWLPATLATPQANSLMDIVQTKPVYLASSLNVSSKSSTPLQSDEASLQQLPIKRFSFKHFSSIRDSYEKFNEKKFNYGEVSQFAAKLDYMVSQRKIALLQIASVLIKTFRRCKRIATNEFRQTTTRIYALISNMDITSYKLPRLNTSLFRKSIKKQDKSFIATIPTASDSSNYLSSLRVSIATSTFEKPSVATIRYLDVLPSNNNLDEVAL